MCMAGGVCDMAGGMHGRGHVWQGGVHGGGHVWQGRVWQILRDTVNERAVSILLECILVKNSFTLTLKAVLLFIEYVKLGKKHGSF